MFWVRPGAYPRVEHYKDASLRKDPTLLANITFASKSLPRPNTLFSLLRTFVNYGRKKFINIGARGGIGWMKAMIVRGLGAKLGKGSPIAGKVWSLDFCNKLQRFSSGSLYGLV
jgi:hypothetical protein